MTHLPRTRNELETTLSDRLARAKEAHAEVTVRWNQVSNLRLLLAAIVVGLGFWWLRTGDATPGYAALGVAVLFLLVLVWHRRLGAQRAELATRATIRQQAMYRTDRDWRSLPDPPPVEISLDHPYALDLDLVGHGSLQHLIDTTQTPEGRQTLLAWLSNGADESEIAARQQVGQEFATADQWREDLQTAGLRVGQPAGSTGELLDWLEQAGAGRIGFRHRFAIALAVGTIVVALLYFSGVIASAWLLPFFVANGILTFATSGAGELSKINSHQRSLTQYRAVLPVAERAPGAQPEVARLRSELMSPSGVASRQLTVLDRALALVIPPGTIIWFPLQVAVNWDLLVEARLRRLATSIGPHIRRWIATVGQIEALAALGDAAALNPDWTWPVVSAGSDSVDGRMLGHPLLSADRRVANDVKVGPAGKVLIVTGSNMAGKSTLLRTIGLNAVLARAGGPVCAESLTMPGLPVWSSVRIQDSLEQGVSLYMAELIRLKQIVDAAKAGPILYLLDEILHGTNTTERRIAARAVIRQLIDAGAIGAVSTHDLELVDAGLDEAAVCVHLVDQVVEGPGGPGMVFDYKVRPGLAPSSNALRLLKLVGLGDGSVT